ncbi:MAG TPA: cysteine desulfurase, partial [bacterium]|nr:cysteine desulfurase [bacterium]
ILCGQTGAKLRVIPITDDGELMMEEFEKLLNARTKFVSIVHISNTLGTINPVRKVIEKAHSMNIPVLVDGAQAVAHMPVDVQALDCDFYAFSGHKMFGPTGVGVLYGKAKWLEAMPPYQGGGDMISSVTFEKTQYNKIPYKFEAGTPNIAGVIGLGSAIDYLDRIGLDKISCYEKDLLDYANQALAQVKGLRIIGDAKEKATIFSMVLGEIHAHDVGTILDHEGIAIRAGHHCTMPLMERFHVPATARASFAMYNTRGEVDALVRALDKVMEVFK